MRIKVAGGVPTAHYSGDEELDHGVPTLFRLSAWSSGIRPQPADEVAYDNKFL
jgi:hypothetical protein